MYDVIRSFDVDYIFFDLVFLAFFLGALIKYKKWIPLAAFFVGGLAINFVVDWGVWLHTGIREVILPVQTPEMTLLFFLWFSLSYGIEYAYVFLMFEKKPQVLKWTLFVFGGWLLVALLSQWAGLHDASITTIRHMGDLRLLRVLIVALGYGLLFALGYRKQKIAFLFVIGFLIHAIMEVTLLVSGVRPEALIVLLENSLIEFNMGVPFFYLLYDKVLRKRYNS